MLIHHLGHALACPFTLEQICLPPRPFSFDLFCIFRNSSHFKSHLDKSASRSQEGQQQRLQKSKTRFSMSRHSIRLSFLLEMKSVWFVPHCLHDVNTVAGRKTENVYNLSSTCTFRWLSFIRMWANGREIKEDFSSLQEGNWDSKGNTTCSLFPLFELKTPLQNYTLFNFYHFYPLPSPYSPVHPSQNPLAFACEVVFFALFLCISGLISCFCGRSCVCVCVDLKDN